MNKRYKICRTCLSEKPEMSSLFTYTELKSEKNTLNFANMLSTIPIQITADDGLPNQICKECVTTLNLTYTFKRQCEEADVWLHKHFDKNFVPTVADDTTDKAINSNNNNLQIVPLNQRKVNSLTSELQNKKSVAQKSLQTDGFKVSVVSKDKTATQYQCQKCNKISKNRIEHKTHIQGHRSYICRLCNRNFRSRHGLSYHTKQHQGIRKFVCPFENCNKSFIIKQTLDKHKATHSVNKNYLCNLCGKPFSTADALSYHLRTHNGERPYSCMQCEKTFTQACHLKTHMWNHTGVKAYLCSTCGKGYSTAFRLKEHISKHCSSTEIRSKKLLRKNNPEHHSDTSGRSNKVLQKSNIGYEKSDQESAEIAVKAILPDHTRPSVEIEYFANQDEIMFVVEEIYIENS